MTTAPVTGQPDQRVAHGAIELIADQCTSCLICVRECPTWCIGLEYHTESTLDSRGGHPSRGRERSTAVLDVFTIDWTLCMYCGICVEECPFDALQWAPEHIPAGTQRTVLSYGIDELRPRGSDPDDADPDAADPDDPDHGDPGQVGAHHETDPP